MTDLGPGGGLPGGGFLAGGSPDLASLDPARRVAPVVRLAPAKLNLSLAVLGRRADGYHELHSVMVTLGLADRLSLATALAAADSLHVSGADTGPPAENLVLRAIAATREAVGAGWTGPAGPPPGLAARLDKRIPVAAGLGGGSSDAAAAIDGALEAWAGTLTIHERMRVALRLGSDVPFFLAGGTAVVEGRGDRVTPLRGIVGDPPGVLLITPRIPVATSAVFAAYATGLGADRGPAARVSSGHLADELRSGLSGPSLVDRAGVLAVANDLLPAASAVAPELTRLRRAVARRTGRPVGLSGSGPTLWVLYPSESEAESAAADLRAMVAAGDPDRFADEPFIAATTITTQPARDRSER